MIDPNVLIAAVITAVVGVVTAVTTYLVGHSQGRAARSAALEQSRATIVAAAIAQGVGSLAELDSLASLSTEQDPPPTGTITLNRPAAR